MPASDARDSAAVEALVAAARAGDPEAFGQLVVLHERVAVRTALAALGRQADAEDAAQDGFLKAWRKLPGFRGDASFRTWLLTIVWREAVGRRRSERRWWRIGRPVPIDADSDRWVPVQLVSRDPGPEDAAASRALVGKVARGIAALSPRLRDTLLLAASGEHSYEEIGRLLGVAVGTVKWRVSEARRRVATAIGRRDGT